MAYEVRISDWSSYVCSSDLAAGDMLGPRRLAAAERGVGDLFAQFVAQSAVMRGVGAEAFALRRKLRIENGRTHALALPRSEERLVGKEFVVTCCSRVSPDP